jgi:hypothetical protein
VGGCKGVEMSGGGDVRGGEDVREGECEGLGS